MTAGRPEILWPLFAGLDDIKGVGAKSRALFEKMGVTRVIDLLHHAPAGLTDRRLRPTVDGAGDGEVVTVEVEIGRHNPPRSKGGPYIIVVRDAACEFLLVFFRAQPAWLLDLAPPGARRVVSGAVQIYDGVRRMRHPDHVLPPAEAQMLPAFEPVYPRTEGLSQRQIARAVTVALERAPALPEWQDPALLAERGWPDWRAALRALHSPAQPMGAAFDDPARARLAYDELLSHQLTLALARRGMRRAGGRVTRGDGNLRAAALAALPYAPTGAQTRAAAEIAADMAAPTRMYRLLQGDVGAGKTLVALLAMLTAVEAGGQAALMAPTELLARQHARALEPLVRAAGARVALLTGRDKGPGRAATLAAVADGEADIVVGTHALFQEAVRFADLRLAVVDEQHRFGVKQRMALAQKGDADLLVMTATPIPRTLALAGYGDMDVSVLDEKPPGRTPVQTRLAPMTRIGDVVARLREALAGGARAYWVCPLVEESDASDLTAAEARFSALRAACGEGVRLVHGQMPSADRDAAMADFAAGRAQLLVATTVIEVGVDVPEASIMVIERAESFGLAQLHQLRGRVGRGAARSACLLLYGPLGVTGRQRLEALRASDDGFYLAEEDLRLRGYGDLLGAQQSGLPRFRLAELPAQADLMALAQRDARLALDRDPMLKGRRGEALRLLLALHDRQEAAALLQAG